MPIRSRIVVAARENRKVRRGHAVQIDMSNAAELDRIKSIADRTNDRGLLLLWVDATASYAPVRVRALTTLRMAGWSVTPMVAP